MEPTRRANKLLAFCLILITSAFFCAKNAFSATITSFSTSSSTVNLELSPSATSANSSTGSHTATIKTTCDQGYRIYVSMTSDSTDNRLHLNGKTSNNTPGTDAIAPTTGSISSATALSNNSWGVKVGSSNVFGAVPLFSEIQKYTGQTSTNPTALITSNQAAATGTDYTITYGANATADLYAGFYTGNVVYTAIMDSSCYTATVNIEKDDHVASVSGVTTGEYPIYSTQTAVCNAADGYTCSWYNGNTQVSTTNSYTFTVPLNGITLTAKSVPNKYTINVNVNGGSSCMTTQFANKSYESSIHVDPCIAPTGKTFMGYAHSATATEPDYLEDSMDGYIPVSTIATTAGVQNTDGAIIQLYAIYVTTTYTVKYNACSGTGNMNDQNFTYGESQNLYINAYTRENYEFAGWNTLGCYVTSEMTNRVNYTQAQNVNNLRSTSGEVNLYAVWTPIAYAYNDNDEGDLFDIYLAHEEDYQQGYYCDDDERAECPFKQGEVVYVTLIKSPGHTLTEWSITGLETGNSIQMESNELYTYFFMPDEPVLIIAVMDGGTKYNLTINKGAHITSTTGQGQHVKDEWVSISAQAEAGYHFSEWTVNSGGASISYPTSSSINFKMPANNVTLTASAVANTYYVKFNGCSNTGGSMNNQTFTYGTAQALSSNAFTRTDYAFGGWSKTGCNQTTPNYSNGQSVNNLTAINGNTFNLYAVWKPKVAAFDDDDFGDKVDIYLASETDHANGRYCAQGAAAVCYFYPGEKVYIKAGYIADEYYFDFWEVETMAEGNSVDVPSDTLEETYFIMPDEPVIVYANMEGIQYTIRFNRTNCSSTSGTMSSMTMRYGESRKLTTGTFTRQNYKLAGWTTDSSACYIDSTSESHVMYTDGQTVQNLADEEGDIVDLYAVWKPGAFAYDDDADGDLVDIWIAGETDRQNGQYCGMGSAAVCYFKAGEKVYITAGWVEADYTFKDWSVRTRNTYSTVPVNSSTSSTTYFTMPNEPVIIVANLEALPTQPNPHTVTLIKGANVTSVGIASEQYYMGEQVLIQATGFAANYTFDSWTVNSGDVTLGNPKAASTTFTMPYRNVTITANARPKTLKDLTTMQQLNSTICFNTPQGESKKLIDTRNNEPYTISKLADGRCWMMEGLKIYDITLTPSDSDVSSNFTLPNVSSPYTTFTIANGRIAPLVNTQGARYYYNYYAATAGTGKNGEGTDAETASSSICPKNWKLPSSPDYQTLTRFYPDYFSLTGTAGFYSDGYFNRDEVVNMSLMIFWSRQSSSANRAYTLLARGGGTATGLDKHDKEDGMNAICIFNP